VIARRLLLACALAAALPGCGDDTPQCTVPDGVYPDWIRTLGCERDYQILWDERADAVFARTRTINWIIDREDGYKTYFLDTKQWDLHYFFAAAYLDVPGKTPVGSHEEFNTLNYRRPGRRFVLGQLVIYADQDLLTLQFAAGDTADADMIADAFGRIRDRLYDGDRMVWRPVSADQEAMFDELSRRIPAIRTEDVFNGQDYQPLNPGVGYGTLRFARLAELQAQPLLPTEIVVLDRVPNDVSLVSGIVTAEFQTPLSHVNLLSKNRGTPNMGLRDAWDDPDLRGLEGELVELTVGPQEFQVEAADPVDAQAYWDSLRPAEPLVPIYDLSVTDPVDVVSARLADVVTIGAKAADLGQLHDVFWIDRDHGDAHVPVTLPLPDRPLAVPFARYDRHLADHGIWTEIEQLVADAPSLAPAELERRLFAIRWHIFRAPMDRDFRDDLYAILVARWGGDADLRFRSSTNVEDLEEFNGAGLYTSAGAKLADGAQAVEDAIKVAWASAWNYQAFIERDWYRVDHRRVYMGVLIHPAFGNELANGVALTINEFTERRPAFYINAQLGEVSVTNPTGQATPEQILYYTWYEEPEYEVITRSSLMADNPDWPAAPAILSDAELGELALYLGAIHDTFNTLITEGGKFPMDVEWKLTPGRQIVIKQARPLHERSTL